MRRFGLTVISFLLTAMVLSAQVIRLDFPVHAGKPLVLMFKRGVHNDTVYTGQLNATGVAVIRILAKETGYAGMARIAIGNNTAFEFVVNHENVALRCNEEYPHGDNVIFTNSAENTALQTGFREQNLRREKLGILGEAARYYSPEEDFYPLLEQERQSLQRTQSAFENELKTSLLYTAKFLRFRNLIETRIAPLTFADSLQMAAMRSYVRDSLDVENLYTSGLWFDVLNGILAAYDKGKPYHKDYIEDMSHVLSRIQSLRIYEDLAKDLFSICESTGWNDLEEQLAYFLLNDGRIQTPPDRLQRLLTTIKLTKGGAAPALTQASLYPKTLLVFYQSGCGPCENEIQQLIGNYPLLKDKGFRVISLSGDTDADVFNNLSRTFPWEDRYCDLQSFSGADFKNYGIIGTPTFFVIENGKVTGRYARLVDIENFTTAQ